MLRTPKIGLAELKYITDEQRRLAREVDAVFQLGLDGEGRIKVFETASWFGSGVAGLAAVSDGVAMVKKGESVKLRTVARCRQFRLA
ncbi:hypothetical protein V493_01613 [Pseudogymnoascus sp. VKM F-4281 (FW-2241)]|nr:hypothetical protein V493_01613 [Pseudogymnoascus sp. VKM F-4281 (FW-2241)]